MSRHMPIFRQHVERLVASNRRRKYLRVLQHTATGENRWRRSAIIVQLSCCQRGLWRWSLARHALASRKDWEMDAERPVQVLIEINVTLTHHIRAGSSCWCQLSCIEQGSTLRRHVTRLCDGTSGAGSIMVVLGKGERCYACTWETCWGNSKVTVLTCDFSFTSFRTSVSRTFWMSHRISQLDMRRRSVFIKRAQVSTQNGECLRVRRYTLCSTVRHCCTLFRTNFYDILLYNYPRHAFCKSFASLNPANDDFDGVQVKWQKNVECVCTFLVNLYTCLLQEDVESNARSWRRNVEMYVRLQDVKTWIFSDTFRFYCHCVHLQLLLYRQFRPEQQKRGFAETLRNEAYVIGNDVKDRIFWFTVLILVQRLRISLSFLYISTTISSTTPTTYSVIVRIPWTHRTFQSFLLTSQHIR